MKKKKIPVFWSWKAEFLTTIAPTQFILYNAGMLAHNAPAPRELAVIVW